MPAKEYAFYQRFLGDPNTNRPTIVGDTDFPGHYRVNGNDIVSIYNQSDHGRSDNELVRMGDINEAFHRGRVEQLRSLIDDTRRTLQQGAAEKVRNMWDAVFKAYGH